MFSGLPLLSLAVWVPILGGVLVLTASQERQANLAKVLALIVSVVTFIITIPLYTQFDVSTFQMQFVEQHAWIPAFNVNYHLGIDGISMPLILLTSFTTVLVVLAGWEVITFKPAQYMAAFLIKEGFMNRVLAAVD